ncbi:hypothetical protein [Thermobifida cellulosilytica]|uniref:Uncharacterized protein n=1 Tax=Thermobifida cellulosilytica TB100 TaxID=665004 RepID=A0A147KIJ6_THECS|nr:hypothetical protein [Thermobifida cellulosilytica]KUP97134.1 hypothetical protein AC529_08450 [Thermobifida cellulosilytica TB100]
MVVTIPPPKEELNPSAAETTDRPQPVAVVRPVFRRSGQPVPLPRTGTLVNSPDDEDDEDDGGPEWLRPPQR